MCSSYENHGRRSKGYYTRYLMRTVVFDKTSASNLNTEIPIQLFTTYWSRSMHHFLLHTTTSYCTQHHTECNKCDEKGKMTQSSKWQIRKHKSPSLRHLRHLRRCSLPTRQVYLTPTWLPKYMHCRTFTLFTSTSTNASSSCYQI